MKKLILIAALAMVFIGCEKRGGSVNSSNPSDGVEPTAEEMAEIEREAKEAQMSAEDQAQYEKEMGGQ